MPMDKHYLAIDLGAESGRVILGTLKSQQLTLAEIHRFATGPVSLPVRYWNEEQQGEHHDCSLVWDFLRFWQEIKESIHKASKSYKISSIGVDSWGVDYALLDKNGELISFPYHYRDNRTDGVMEKAFDLLPRERIYQITGNQFMQLNTLFQLLSLKLADSPFLKITDKLVMIPDLVNYWLTGRVVSEFSEATTSQIFDSRKGEWSKEIIAAMGLPGHIFPDVIESGYLLGPLRKCLQAELNCDALVVAPPTHDTASAVAAVPAETEDFIWISSGTWSIVGINSPVPIINEKSYAGNFTNEGGKAGTFCFSKNITGLWLVQQCRRQWQNEGKDYSYTDLTQLAEKAPRFKTIVDTDFSEFLEMGNMVEKIHNYCQLTQQPIPENEGEMIRAVLQGLALRYRYTIEQLEEISGRKAEVIHIVGGGTKNQLLNQLTADALQREVITGPAEATAIGNIIAQAIAMGDINDWQEGFAVIKNSFEINSYSPGDASGWDQAYEQFKTNLDKIILAF